MKLADAITISEIITMALRPFCHPDCIEIVGSIRRERADVKDIDILLIPLDSAMEKIKRQCLITWKDPNPWTPPTANAWGEKIARFKYLGVTPIDLYFASSETWPILELIRTGSKEHNRYLCDYARRNNMRLAADGSGLWKWDTKIARNPIEVQVPVVCESDIFKALGLDYIEPKNRER